MLVDTFLGGPLAEAPANAVRAEALGYDAVSTGEVSHDALFPLVLAAPATQRLGLATSIVVAFARTPMALALQAWDLQQLSGGRLQLGLGSQVKAHITRRFSMPWSHPAPRMREYVLALKAIWSCWQDGTPLDFEGEFYRHTLMTPAFNPGPAPGGAPKVSVAAVGEHMTDVAAEVADGLLCHGFTTRRYVEEVTLPRVEGALARAGRPSSAFEVKYSPFVATGATEEQLTEAIKATKAQVAFYGSTPSYRGVLDLHGWGDLHEELHRLSRQGEWATMASIIDDEVLDAFAVVAEPDQLARRIAERIAGLTDRTSFSAPGLSDEQLRDGIATLRAVATRAEQAGADAT